MVVVAVQVTKILAFLGVLEEGVLLMANKIEEEEQVILHLNQLQRHLCKALMVALVLFLLVLEEGAEVDNLVAVLLPLELTPIMAELEEMVEQFQ